MVPLRPLNTAKKVARDTAYMCLVGFVLVALPFLSGGTEGDVIVGRMVGLTSPATASVFTLGVRSVALVHLLLTFACADLLVRAAVAGWRRWGRRDSVLKGDVACQR